MPLHPEPECCLERVMGGAGSARHFCPVNSACTPVLFLHLQMILLIMKKILFALPVLVFALALSFCSKQPQEVVADQINQTAGDRATCTLTVTGNSAVTFCGTDPTAAVCAACVSGGSPSLFHHGTQTLSSGSGTVVINANPTPYPLSIYNSGTSTSKYNIDTGTNSITITLGAGDCEELLLDANCNISIL